MNSQQRRQYRVSDLQRYNLRARIVMGRNATQVALTDVSYDAAGLFVADKLAITLRPGQGVLVRFDSNHLDRSLEVSATVMARRPGDGGIHYGVQFNDPAGLQRKLSPRVAGAFNRRGTYRVAPDAMMAQIQLRKMTPFSLPVICVSASGCALWVPKGEAAPVQAGDQLVATLTIPDLKAITAVVQARVKYTLPQREGARVGIEFDAGRTEHFARVETIITSYVMRLQRRMLTHE